MWRAAYGYAQQPCVASGALRSRNGLVVCKLYHVRAQTREDDRGELGFKTHDHSLSHPRKARARYVAARAKERKGALQRAVLSARRTARVSHGRERAAAAITPNQGERQGYGQGQGQGQRVRVRGRVRVRVRVR